MSPADLPADLRAALAARIDHTLLAPDATAEQVRAHCLEGARLQVASVCVSPSRVALAVACLADTPTPVCAVVGFPHGTHTPDTKAHEAAEAIAAGAAELDMVLTRGPLREGDDEAVLADVRAVVAAAAGRPVKVILETAALDDDLIRRGCALAERSGARFVKTSTGFGPGGATTHAVALMRAAVGPEVAVKASGGIRDGATALAMLAAGASRLGASKTAEILATIPADATLPELRS